MKKTFSFISCILTLCILLNTSALAVSSSSVSSADLQSKNLSEEYTYILKTINNITVSDDEISDLEKVQADIVKQIDESASRNSDSKVVFDFTEDLRAIKLSLSEPVVIYYEIGSSIDVAQSSRSYDYSGTLTASATFTYNGVATTVKLTSGYTCIYDGYTDTNNSTYDCYRYQYSRSSFSANGGAHVSYILARHYQEGFALDSAGGNYTIAADGQSYSADRTDESFSTSDSSGYTVWSKSITDYTTASSLDVGGCLGSNYIIGFNYWNGSEYVTEEYQFPKLGIGTSNMPTF